MTFDKNIMFRVKEHYQEALKYFNEDHIVGIFLQGSQNYGLEIPSSDVDTKLITVPSFSDIAFNKKLISTTHIRANNEHIDFKDIRLYMQTFRKQNLNFLEILFTDYFIVNPLYKEEWNCLVTHREEIAHYNRFLAVKAIKGIALEKFHAMEHRYPSKIAVIDKFGYDPKQLHHLLRVEEFLERYINGKDYGTCMKPHNPEHLKAVKMGLYSLEDARVKATVSMTHINEMAAIVSKGSSWDVCDQKVESLLDEVQYKIMKKAVMKELTN